MRLDQQQQTRRFYDVVWPHRADVLRVARFLSRDPIMADDLAQECMLKAFRGLDKIVAGPGIKAWLLQILRNTWLDRLRASAARPMETSLGDLSDEPATEVSVDNAGTGVWGDPRAVLEAFSDQQVIDALQGLPEEIRWTLLLVDVEGLSLQETAGVLDVPTGTIKSRSHRGRRMLREKLLPLARELRLVPSETKERSSRMEEI